MKKLLSIILTTSIIIGLIAVLLYLASFGSTGKGEWLCQEGRWIKSGQLFGPAPGQPCRTEYYRERSFQPIIASSTEAPPERDEYGCLVAAGFSWCAKHERCLRGGPEICERDELNIVSE